ncbi:MAG: hypothetical protein AB7E05_13265 [Sphingobium sp.]
MKSLSIGMASQECGQFLKREAGLLVPVALLFTGIPVALLLQAIPPSLRQMAATEQAAANVTLPGSAMVLLFFCPLLVLVGTLTTYALALRPGISLGEALRLGFRRMPVALGAALLMGAALAVPMLVLGAVSEAIASGVLLVGALLLSARLLPVNAVVVNGEMGVLAALRESWTLSSGHLLRLLGFVVLMSIPIMIAQTVGQALFGVIGFALGGKEVARQAGDVGAAMALSLGQMVMIVMTAFLYRQLRGGDRGGDGKA